MKIDERARMCSILIDQGIITTPSQYLSLLHSSDEVSVDGWCKYGNLSEDNIAKYPNAKVAALMKSSPLWQELK